MDSSPALSRSTVFNPQLKVCDHPENVDLPEGYCEYDDVFYLKPHFCDCRKYVVCEPGNPHKSSCVHKEDVSDISAKVLFYIS
nr:unnamed protein product [Callosobruchus analis]